MMTHPFGITGVHTRNIIRLELFSSYFKLGSQPEAWAIGTICKKYEQKPTTLTVFLHALKNLCPDLAEARIPPE